MASTISQGTMDGQPAKVVYYPERKQTMIYWGGVGKPDGFGHNHATILDANPDAIHFMRVNGQVVVNQGYNPNNPLHRRNQAAGAIVRFLRDAPDTVRRHWRI